MDEIDPSVKDRPPAVAPVVITPEVQAEIAGLAARQRKAGGALMRGITFVGGQVEDGLRMLPAAVRGQIDDLARAALRHSYDLACKSTKGRGRHIGSDRLHKLIGTVSGAVGGFGGLPTAIIELPVTTTVIFRAVHQVAVSYGEDPQADATRMECLAVFGAGAPGEADDGIDTVFIATRLSLSGAAVNGLIARVAPRFAAVLSQKLASQSVPVLGAAAGAGTNFAFVDYYVTLAHVHFGLRRLARTYGEVEVTEAFHAALAAKQVYQT